MAGTRVTTTRVINPETASEKQKLNLLTKNQQVAAQLAAQYASDAAQRVQGFGKSAAAGGLFMDTSARPGYQSPVTGQGTGMLMRMITDPMQANVKGMNSLALLRRNRLYQSQLKDAAAGSAATIGGYGATPPATTTTPQLIL